MSTLKQKEMQQGIYVGPPDIRPNRDRKDPEPTGAELIAKERKRQIEKGYTVEHDSQHDISEMLSAAIAYMVTSIKSLRPEEEEESLMAAAKETWPWEEESFKPTTSVKDLSKAGAIIAATIDMLQS